MKTSLFNHLSAAFLVLLSTACSTPRKASSTASPAWAPEIPKAGDQVITNFAPAHIGAPQLITIYRVEHRSDDEIFIYSQEFPEGLPLYYTHKPDLEDFRRQLNLALQRGDTFRDLLQACEERELKRFESEAEKAP